MEKQSNSHEGLSKPMESDRVAKVVRLLVASVTNFGSCWTEEAIIEEVRLLGRSDASVVRNELLHAHKFVHSELETVSPDVLRVLEEKCS